MIWKFQFVLVLVCLSLSYRGTSDAAELVTPEDSDFTLSYEGTTECQALISINYIDTNTNRSSFKMEIVISSEKIVFTNISDVGLYKYTLKSDSFQGIGTFKVEVIFTEGEFITMTYMNVTVEIQVEGNLVDGKRRWNICPCSFFTKYVIPGEEFTIHVKNHTGDDALDTIQYEEAVQVIKSCDGNALEKDFTDSANDSRTFHLFPISTGVKTGSSIPMVFMPEPNGFTVKAESPVVHTTEDAKFIITLSNDSQVLMGNLTLFLQCEGNTTTEPLTINPMETQNVSCRFNIQGNYTVDITISNDFGSSTHVFNVFVWDIINATLCLDNTYNRVDEIVPFYLSNSPSFGFQYKIDFGNGRILENTNPDILYTPYSPINLTGISYSETGYYNVRFTRYNQFYYSVQDVNVVVGEVVIEWPKETAIHTGEMFVININATQGPNYTMYVNYAEILFMNDHCNCIQTNHSYNSTGFFTVRAFVVGLSTNISEWRDVQVLYDYNGITVGQNQTLIEPTDNATFYIHMNQDALVPIGNLTVTISPCGTSYLEEIISIFPGDTKEIICSFTTPGDYTVNITIQSPFGSEESLNMELRAWNVLNMSLQTDIDAFAVNSQPTFEIIDVPLFGFKYIIDFGETTIIKNEDSAILTTPYVNIEMPTSLHYNTPGQYIVNFTAYNGFYMVSNNFCLNVEYGLPPSYAQVSPNRTYIIYDDVATFDIYSNSNSSEPKPTNVTCDIDYGDGTKLINEPTGFEYHTTGLGLTLTHNYTTPSTYQVVINCSNLVSRIVLTYSIDVVEIHLNDFNINFSAVNLLNETASGLFQVELKLYDLTYPPHNIKLEWNFKDGSDAEIDDPMTSFVKQHTYTNRGSYAVSLAITYHGVVRTETLNINMGASYIERVSSTEIGLVSVTSFDFEVHNYLPGIPVSVNIIWGDGTSDTLDFAPDESMNSTSHIFEKAGSFMPEIVTTSSAGTEYSFLASRILIENQVQDLTWNVPPTVVVFNAFLPELVYTGDVFLNNLECTFNYSELTFIQENINFSMQSRSVFSPQYSFNIIGEVSLSLNCSNLVSHQALTKIIIVLGGCFSMGRMFPTEYRNMSTPLRAYRSIMPVISEQIEIKSKCQNSTGQSFKWKVSKQVPSGWTQLNVISPNAKVYDMAMSQLDPGLFRVACRMTLYVDKVESIEDYMYLELLNPPLVAVIAGGTERIFGNDTVFTLNAVSESFDPVIGYGRDNKLTFSWHCYQVEERELDGYTEPESIDISYREKTPCDITLASDDIITVSTSSLQSNAWYLFEAMVSKDSRTASAVQAVHVVDVVPIETFLVCKWNCEVKKWRHSRMVYESNYTCADCLETQRESVTFQWFFYIYNGLAYVLVPNTDPHFLSAPNASVFELDADFMEEGKHYKLKVIISNAEIGASGWASSTFTVNENPYDGTCTVSPLTGIATVDDFVFECIDWKDEGPRNSRNETIDAFEPLTYLITQLKGTDSQIIYDGNAAASIQKLEVCPGEECTIEFRIRDLFNSESIVLVDVTVSSPSPDLPPLSLDTPFNPNNNISDNPLTKFLEGSEVAIKVAKMSNDSEKIAKQASGHLATINNIKLPGLTSSRVADAAAETDGSVNDIVANVLTRLTSPDLLMDRVQETTAFMTKTILECIELLAVAPFLVGPGNTDSNGNVLPTTVPSVDLLILLTSTLATAIKEPDVVKPNVEADVTKGTYLLSKTLMEVLKYSRDVNTIEKAIAAIGRAQNNLNKNQAGDRMVEDLEDLEGSEEFVTKNLTDGDKKFNDVERKYTKMLIDKRRQVEINKKLKYMALSRRTSENITDYMFRLMDRIQMDGSKKNHNEEGFGLSLEKDTMDNIITGDRQPLSGAKFDLGGIGNQTLGDKERVKFQLRVIKDNIYKGGENAKLVTSPVIVAHVKKEDGSSVAISRPVIKQTDPTDAPYVLIRPKFITEDAAHLFYHRFFYRSLSLQVCLSVLPIGDTPIVYDMFLRSIIPPTDIDFDYYTSYEAEEGESGTNFCIREGALKRTGVAFVGLRPRLNTVTPTAEPVSRKRRSVVNVNMSTSAANTTSEEKPDILETPYMFRVVTLACMYWNASIDAWTSDACKLSRDEKNNMTSCNCPDSLDVVASVSFFVAPNKIDFSTVFSKFDIAGQGAVLGTLILILVIFIMSALYSRYKDGQDVLQWGVSLLEDNFSDDSYFYLITVYTGMIRQGGTKSNIEFSISGEEGDTGIRVLSDGVRKEFSAGSVLHFIMAVPQSLGRLQYLAIWHDNSGKGTWASWYLNRMEVMDLQTKEKTDFIAYKWLSLEAGQIHTVTGAGNTENLKNFKTMFFEHARHHVSDDHLWLSTILRPVKSHFSRVQRVGCCFALLLLSMISNAMFFKGREFKDRKQSFDFELGPIKFNVSQIWTSFVSALITAVPVFVMMLLFRKSKLSKSETSTGEFKSHWMLPCFKRFKFYKDSVALQKVLVIKDIVDDEEGVLPHAFVYVAWVLVFLSALASSFFVMLYSMEWGKDISEEFLLAFFLSFAESMFILDPFKIMFLAIIFAMILRQIKSARPTEFDLEYIGTMNTKNGKPTEKRIHVDYKNPFTESEVEAARFKFEQKTKMHKAISEFVVTVFLLILLCSICYSNRDPYSFVLRTTLRDQLVTPHKPILPMTKVHSVRDYFHWLNYTVLPAMFPEEHYNSEVLGSHDRQFLSDQTNMRIGAPRLRQVRQNKTSCFLPYIGTVVCIPRYFVVTEDTSNYCQSWSSSKPCDEDEGLKLTSAAWTFISAKKIWGLPIQGSFNTYGGGGYIAELDISMPVAKATIQELVEMMWVDRETRAVFLEFTVYCVNLNMFAYISLLAEFPETGSILYYPNIYTFRSLGPTGTLGTYIIICEVLFMLATVVWLVVIALRLLKERWTFFRRFWNIIELATVCLSFAAIVLYFIKLRYTSEAIAKFKENSRIFVNFYHIAVWDNVFIMVVSIVIAILTVRLIKVMGYTKTTRTVYTVLKHSSKTLPDFFLYITVVLFVFACTGYLHFGSEAKEYKDIVTCLETLFSGVLGHAGFTKVDIPLENNWFGLIYFITFIIMVVFTVANIFMAILLDTMDMLANDKSAEKDLELTSFLWNYVHEVVTGKKENQKFKSKTEQARSESRMRHKIRALLNTGAFRHGGGHQNS